MATSINFDKLKDLAAKYRLMQEASAAVTQEVPLSEFVKKNSIRLLESLSAPTPPSPETPIAKAIETLVEPAKEDPGTFTDRFGKTIIYNEKQMQFVNLATEGKDCILIGAAGTGKTTCMKGVVSSLIQNGLAGVLTSGDCKYLVNGSPGIAIVAFTRRAVNNIRKNMPEDLKDNCITIHKLLEYEPVFYTVIDPISGKEKNKVEFRPARNEMRPLPNSLRVIVFEESSMVGTDLHQEVENAMPHDHQEIYLGDIQQLPPVFGPAILGFKLLELPVVELTEVYRQALESPIIRLAHRILSGKVIQAAELKTMQVPGQLKIVPWSKTITPSAALAVLGNNLPDKNGHMGYFPECIKAGHYDPELDMILIPQNVGLGTEELNKYIAQYLARTANREVFEVVAGFEKRYFSVGEKVMYERADGIITKIEVNPLYSGSKTYRPASKTLTYWGMETARSAPKERGIEDQNLDVDFILTQVAASKDEDRVHQASHRITILLADSEKEIVIDKASQINGTILGYALTVHKSQGSEWRRVFVVFHKEHNRMLQRELLYTAVTRAREELICICEMDSFVQGIESQRIKGNTLAEKAEYFKGKYKAGDYES